MMMGYQTPCLPASSENFRSHSSWPRVMGQLGKYSSGAEAPQSFWVIYGTTKAVPLQNRFKLTPGENEG